jgi:hypothetical protein
MKKITEETTAFVNKEMNNTSFKWSGSTIPGPGCEPIDYILRIIKTSIAELISELNKCIDSSRMFIYERVNINSGTVKKLSKMAEEEKKDVVDTESKVYVSNYKMFSETVKDIIKNSDIILKEILQKEIPA